MNHFPKCVNSSWWLIFLLCYYISFVATCYLFRSYFVHTVEIKLVFFFFFFLKNLKFIHAWRYSSIGINSEDTFLPAIRKDIARPPIIKHRLQYVCLFFRLRIRETKRFCDQKLFHCSIRIFFFFPP